MTGCWKDTSYFQQCFCINNIEMYSFAAVLIILNEIQIGKRREIVENDVLTINISNSIQENFINICMGQLVTRANGSYAR